MDDYERIHIRFGFQVPADYRRFVQTLLVEGSSEQLKLSRLFWLKPRQIADISWPNYKKPGIIPCAQTYGRDHLCWVINRNGGSWIADCPRDSDFATGFAPSFEGAMFRAILDEFSDSWLTADLLQASTIFRSHADRYCKALRNEWAQIIKGLASEQPWFNSCGRPQVVSSDRAASIVARELAFEHLGAEIRQHDS